MHDWPPITEPRLLARLALSDDEFLAFTTRLVGSFGSREFTDEGYARALSYPWARPGQSFVVERGQVERLVESPEDLIADAPRFPLLAFGSNGSPDTLATKFHDLGPDERRVVALTGELHDFDVGAAAAPTNYGAFPGTLFPSPGTAVHATVLWVTAAQLTALVATEFTYLFGRLDDIRFVPEVAGDAPLERVYAFVSRWGAHCVDDRVVALDAVQARNRIAPSCTQEELLDELARAVFGPAANAATVVARILDDFPAAAEQIRPVLSSRARRFESNRWTSYPTAS